MELIPFPSYSLIGMDDLQRFWAKFQRKGEQDCWPWIAGFHSHPVTGLPRYGNFVLFGESYYAHRVAYFFHYKVDPGKLLVCHRCNNTSCVNPNHLELGTQSDNVQFAFDCGRATNKGELHPRANFSNQEAKMIRETDEPIPILAKRFGVHYSVIYKIKIGETFKGV